MVTSEESLKILLDKIPKCEVNGERIDCRFATRQNLAMFEDTANKRESTTVLRKWFLLHYIAKILQWLKNNVFSAGIPLRVNSKDPRDSDSSEMIPSLLSQEPSPPPMHPLFPSNPCANRFPSLHNPFLSQAPPPFPHMPPNIPQPLPPPLFPHLPVHVPSQPTSSLHINPAVFTSAQDGHSSKVYSQQK